MMRSRFEPIQAYRHFTNVLQKAQVVRVVLDPSYLEVAINVCAVRVSISQVLVVEFAV